MAILVRATFRVHPGRDGQFVELVAALIDRARGEAGTLRYEWFESDDPGVYVGIEEYTAPDAAALHNEHCADLLEKVSEAAEMTSVHLHGDLGPELEAWIAEYPQAHGHPPLCLGSCGGADDENRTRIISSGNPG